MVHQGTHISNSNNLPIIHQGTSINNSNNLPMVYQNNLPILYDSNTQVFQQIDYHFNDFNSDIIDMVEVDGRFMSE